jgi:hypothetical protein
VLRSVPGKKLPNCHVFRSGSNPVCYPDEFDHPEKAIIGWNAFSLLFSMIFGISIGRIFRKITLITVPHFISSFGKNQVASGIPDML